MARLNIEDHFWLELLPLAISFGDQDKAIGNVVRFFRFAQEKHKLGKMIEEHEFKDQGFSENLIPNFAKRTSDGIQAAGAEKHFGWLRERVEAGKKGGKSNSPDKIKHLKQNLSKTEANRSKTEASPSSSSSSSNSSSPSLKIHTSTSSPIISLWNSLAHKNLSKVVANSKKREASCNARWAENPNEQYWRNAIDKMNRSSFLIGEETSWKANFDWFIKPDSCLKIVEGQYSSNEKLDKSWADAFLKKHNSEGQNGSV